MRALPLKSWVDFARIRLPFYLLTVLVHGDEVERALSRSDVLALTAIIAEGAARPV
jgi:hypothetical protein